MKDRLKRKDMLENAWEAIRWASKEIELGMDWESDNIIKKERFRDKSFFKFFNIFRNSEQHMKFKNKMKSTNY